MRKDISHAERSTGVSGPSLSALAYLYQHGEWHQKAGRSCGQELAMYGHDAGVWPKCILSDEFGVTPDQCRWIVGRIDFPIKPVDCVPQPHPAKVEVTTASPDQDLRQMLSRESSSLSPTGTENRIIVSQFCRVRFP